VPSVEKALDVFELLADAPLGLTMNEIVDALGRTMGELYRIVVYLAERGYIEQDEATARYALTLRLFELSHRHDPTERLLRNAIPLMERFAATTEQSCHLGVVSQRSVLILASVASPRPLGFAVRTGAVFPLAQTSTGNVILAFAEDAVRRTYLAGLPTAERKAVEQRLGHIREKGFEDRMSLMVNGMRNLSVPVFNSRGVLCALTTGYIGQVDQVMSPEEALAEIQTAANELSAALGGSGMARSHLPDGRNVG
jgi:DNA-binding IclR family transcriptional regulator